MTEPEILKAHCNQCGPFISHTVLAKVAKSWADEDTRLDGTDRYFLLECRGCERVRLRHDSWNSYDVDEEGDPKGVTTYYPPAISRKPPGWLTSPGPFLFNFNHPIRRLLNEVYSAMQNDSHALAAMGIRALIEHVMTEQIGKDTGSIGNNVTKFISAGFIAPKSEPLFREFLIESGHAAMHRAYFPKPSDIVAMLDIAESVIETIYIHPFNAKPGNIPPRKIKD